MNILSLSLLWLVTWTTSSKKCQPCYKWELNQQCPQLGTTKLHMSLHTDELIASKLFQTSPVGSQLKQRYFAYQQPLALQVFNQAQRVLSASRLHRINVENTTQKAHRTYFTSQIAEFQQWYATLSVQHKKEVATLVKSGYWQILGGAIVSSSSISAYYDDIILNFELGLKFLKEELNYFPKIAISSDPLGFSQSTIAILANLGIEGSLLLTYDPRWLLQNRTEFLWRAISSNNHPYGSVMTHINWYSPNLKDLFNNQSQSSQDLCKAKDKHVSIIRRQNQLLRQLKNNSHLMRSFFRGIQKIDESRFQVMENIMERLSMEKCPGVMGFYSNPTNFFLALMGEVLNKAQSDIAIRKEDILIKQLSQGSLLQGKNMAMSGYYSKFFRDFGRLVLVLKKLSLSLLLANNSKLDLLSDASYLIAHSQQYDYTRASKSGKLKQLKAICMKVKLQLKEDIIDPLFQLEIEPKGRLIFDCILGQNCILPGPNQRKEDLDRIGVKIINPEQTTIFSNAWIELPLGEYWISAGKYNILCLCPKRDCPCRLYLLDQIQPYSFLVLTKLHRSQSLEGYPIYRGARMESSSDFKANKTHFSINFQNKSYSISYKKSKVRMGNEEQDDENKEKILKVQLNKLQPFQEIQKAYALRSSDYTAFYLHSKKNRVTTLITARTSKPNQWLIQTYISQKINQKRNIYLQISSDIKNDKSFYTDSNGWLVSRRKMVRHQTTQSDELNIEQSMYPASAFAYIEDAEEKLSVNFDRTQKVASPSPGNLLMNFATLGETFHQDKQQDSYHPQYQRYTHWITAQNKDSNERKIQKAFDQPSILQVIAINQSVLESFVSSTREKWEALSGIGEIKWTASPLKNSSVLVRLHNLKDWEKVEVRLAAGNVSPLLTSFYGRTVTFSEVKQMSLGGNMDYSQFLDKKWNWPYISSLKKDNLIFNRIFRQNITLQPLQIRTFKFINLTLSDSCIGPEDDNLNYTGKQVIYTLKSEKPAPKRSQTLKQLEKKIEKYLIQGDHCSVISPVRQPQEFFFDKKGKSEEHGRKSIQDQQQTLQVLKGKVEYNYPLSKHQKQHYFTFKLTEISSYKQRNVDESLVKDGQKVKNSQEIN